MPTNNKNRRQKRKPQKKKGVPTNATKSWGPSAKGELVRRIPVFNKPFHRVMIPYYAYQQQITGAAGIITTRFFSANGAYDPDVTGTGHQPMGFDTMMLYYEQYCVVRSKITVTFVNKGVEAVRAAISLTPDTTAPVIGDLVENGLIRPVVLDAPNNSSGSGGRYGRIAVDNLSCDTASFFGRKSHRELLDDTSLNGNSAANPSEQVYFAVSSWGGFSTDNTTVNYDVILEYDVIFWEPRKLSQQMEKDISILLQKQKRRSSSAPSERKTS